MYSYICVHNSIYFKIFFSITSMVPCFVFTVDSGKEYSKGGSKVSTVYVAAGNCTADIFTPDQSGASQLFAIDN